ncbi:hypothetical protein [Thalassospira sp.]|uniref:hypothetical protein n=1 Tax=Thalassospira sp. TaxID=1912094 RepID=UPI00311DFA48
MKNKNEAKTKIYVVCTRFIQIFIVLCLVGGFADITIPIIEYSISAIEKKVSETQRPSVVEPGSVNDIVEEWPALSVSRMPGIEGALKEYHSAKINISADGMRSNGPLPRQDVKSTVLLLGSSPAWGYRIADHQTLSAHLERNLINTRVENYAGLAQNLRGNILRWYSLSQNEKKPDLVIISGASTDIGLNCSAFYNIQNSRNNNHDSKNLYYNLYRKFWKGDIENHEDFICDSELNQNLAVQQSILAVKNAVSFARQQGIPFYLVYLPTPYDGYDPKDPIMDIRNIHSHLSTKQHVFKLYHEILKEMEVPELIDLSQFLPADGTYFLDKGSHLSENANKLIAAKISDRIRQDFPSIFD